MSSWTSYFATGHQLFARFPEVWKPVVAEFLRKQGFEMKEAK